jgi:hypothetical protein
MLSRCLWIASLITFFGVLDACLARALGYSAITSTVVHATLIVFCVIKLNEYESDSVSDRLERARRDPIAFSRSFFGSAPIAFAPPV